MDQTECKLLQGPDGPNGLPANIASIVLTQEGSPLPGNLVVRITLENGDIIESTAPLGGN